MKILSNTSYFHSRKKKALKIKDIFKISTKIIEPKFDGTFYLCGLKNMIVSTTKKLEEVHIPKDFIFYESYD